MNLHWAPVNSAHEDLQRVVKANLVCFPCICDQNVYGTSFAYRRLTALVKCAKTIKGRCSSLKMLGSEQGGFDDAAGNHSQLLPGKDLPSLETKSYEDSTTVLKTMIWGVTGRRQPRLPRNEVLSWELFQAQHSFLWPIKAESCLAVAALWESLHFHQTERILAWWPPERYQLHLLSHLPLNTVHLWPAFSCT